MHVALSAKGKREKFLPLIGGIVLKTKYDYAGMQVLSNSDNYFTVR